MGAAGGGDDVLKAVEKLKEIMYFEVLQLLGQGCNGAVFKVGRARVCVFFVFVPRGCPPQFARVPIASTVCPACLVTWLLACFVIPDVSRQRWCTRPWPTACSWR